MQVTINGLAIHGRHHLATESSSIRLVEGLELVHTEFLHMVTQSLKSEYIHIIFTPRTVSSGSSPISLRAYLSGSSDNHCDSRTSLDNDAEEVRFLKEEDAWMDQR